MSDNPIPSASTPSPVNTPETSVLQGFISESMIAFLRAASPWIRFMSIIGFIGAGFLILSGITMVITAPFLSSLDASHSLRAFSGTVGLASGLLYTAMGVFYVIPSVFLYRFGSRVNDFVQTNNEQALEHALKNNKAYWKFNGIVTIISIASMFMVLISTIIIALINLAK